MKSRKGFEGRLLPHLTWGALRAVSNPPRGIGIAVSESIGGHEDHRKEEELTFHSSFPTVKEVVSKFRSFCLMGAGTILATETSSPRLRRTSPFVHYLEDSSFRTTDLRFARHVVVLCRKMREGTLFTMPNRHTLVTQIDAGKWQWIWAVRWMPNLKIRGETWWTVKLRVS